MVSRGAVFHQALGIPQDWPLGTDLKEGLPISGIRVWMAHPLATYASLPTVATGGRCHYAACSMSGANAMTLPAMAAPPA